ncbi:MAG: alpha/beta fold hydrolase [Eggerthellaceae bacterium]|nr:alpha/beta fold hydrolase [Eggerthellaceae bacterium]
MQDPTGQQSCHPERSGEAAESKDLPGPLLFLHGFAQGGESWGEVAGLLERPFAVLPLYGAEDALPSWDETGPAPAIALDLPGSGSLAALNDPALYHLDAASAQVRAVARAMAAAYGTPPVVVGYSQGGRLLLHALTTRTPADPLPLSALVLESAGLGPAPETERAAFANRSHDWAAKARTQGTESFMNWWGGLPLFASQRALPEDRRALLRQGRLANNSEALARALEGMGQQHQASEAETLAALDVLISQDIPVTFISGNLDAKYTAIGEKLADRFAARPAFAHIIVENAGHNVHFEQPAAFAELLR